MIFSIGDFDPFNDSVLDAVAPLVAQKWRLLVPPGLRGYFDGIDGTARTRRDGLRAGQTLARRGGASHRISSKADSGRKWSGIRESNSRLHLGKVAYYHYTNPAHGTTLCCPWHL
jgi:hypothetical protein